MRSQDSGSGSSSASLSLYSGLSDSNAPSEARLSGSGAPSEAAPSSSFGASRGFLGQPPDRQGLEPPQPTTSASSGGDKPRGGGFASRTTQALTTAIANMLSRSGSGSNPGGGHPSGGNPSGIPLAQELPQRHSDSDPPSVSGGSEGSKGSAPSREDPSAAAAGPDPGPGFGPAPGGANGRTKLYIPLVGGAVRADDAARHLAAFVVAREDPGAKTAAAGSALLTNPDPFEGADHQGVARGASWGRASVLSRPGSADHSSLRRSGTQDAGGREAPQGCGRVVEREVTGVVLSEVGMGRGTGGGSGSRGSADVGNGAVSAPFVPPRVPRLVLPMRPDSPDLLRKSLPRRMQPPGSPYQPRRLSAAGGGGSGRMGTPPPLRRAAPAPDPPLRRPSSAQSLPDAAAHHSAARRQLSAPDSSCPNDSIIHLAATAAAAARERPPSPAARVVQLAAAHASLMQSTSQILQRLEDEACEAQPGLGFESGMVDGLELSNVKGLGDWERDLQPVAARQVSELEIHRFNS